MENKQPRVNTLNDNEQDEKEYFLHCFEFADDKDDWLVMRVDHTRMDEDYDDLFSRLGRVKNFTYDINVDEEAVFDH
jgi:hypothetical protein